MSKVSEKHIFGEKDQVIVTLFPLARAASVRVRMGTYEKSAEVRSPDEMDKATLQTVDALNEANTFVHNWFANLPEEEAPF